MTSDTSRATTSDESRLVGQVFADNLRASGEPLRHAGREAIQLGRRLLTSTPSYLPYGEAASGARALLEVGHTLCARGFRRGAGVESHPEEYALSRYHREDALRLGAMRVTRTGDWWRVERAELPSCPSCGRVAMSGMWRGHHHPDGRSRLMLFCQFCGTDCGLEPPA